MVPHRTKMIKGRFTPAAAGRKPGLVFGPLLKFCLLRPATTGVKYETINALD
jgi:hypothetical protein